MKALIIVDVQNDFLPGGTLAVQEGNRVVPIINELARRFELVVATKDWHPADHSSFTIWNPHCIQNTPGAEFAPELDTTQIDETFLKGTDREIDSYSGFFDNEHRRATGLGEFLRARGVTEIAVCGLAIDYCVKFTALDALKLGFKTMVFADACRGVEVENGDTERSIEEMRRAGALVVDSGIANEHTIMAKS